MQYISHYESPLGGVILESDGKALTGLWFGGGKFSPDTISDETQEKDLPVFEQTKNWLDIYFNSEVPDFTPPLAVCGSDFRKAVWEILQTIPYGQTMTYGAIAKMIAKQRGFARMSAQAVGQAVGRNPISIIVPCHRVVGTGGNLTGYGGGIDKKIALLTLEKADMEQFYVPKKGTAL